WSSRKFWLRREVNEPPSARFNIESRAKTELCAGGPGLANDITTCTASARSTTNVRTPAGRTTEGSTTGGVAGAIGFQAPKALVTMALACSAVTSPATTNVATSGRQMRL